VKSMISGSVVRGTFREKGRLSMMSRGLVRPTV